MKQNAAPRALALAISAFASLTVPAYADPCREEIVALFDGGALDPFAQPPYAYDTTVYAPDDSVKYAFYTVFDTPLRSLSGIKGQFMTLAIGNRTWTGPGPEGPWTETPNSLPADLEAFHKTTRDQLARNVTAPVCHGVVQKGDGSYLVYEFTTQTDPDQDQGGTYFGAREVDYVDPESGRLMRREQTGQFAHYQPEPGADRWVMIYRYDPALSLRAPE